MLNLSRLLGTALLASITASACCLGPFLMLATGLSGAWMSRVMVIEPIQPILAAFSLLLMAIAGWQLLSAKSCESMHADTVAVPSWNVTHIMFFIIVLSLVLILISSEYWIQYLAG